MLQPTLYRKRLIPMESVLLKDDRILFLDSHMLITGWHTLKPKQQLAFGYSCYRMDEGLKISRFYDHDGRFMYWYCDIIDTSFDPSANTYIFTDLLVDVVIFPDSSTRILDLDELSEAFSSELLDKRLLLVALNRLHNLLQIIYSDQFDTLVQPLLAQEASDRLQAPT